MSVNLSDAAGLLIGASEGPDHRGLGNRRRPEGTFAGKRSALALDNTRRVRWQFLPFCLCERVAIIFIFPRFDCF